MLKLVCEQDQVNVLRLVREQDQICMLKLVGVRRSSMGMEVKHDEGTD